MRQFFVSEELKCSDVYEFDEKQAHHIRNVLRMNENEPVRIVDATSQAFSGRLRFTDRKVFVFIEEKTDKKDSDREVVYAAALIKKDKWELLLQKASELGASRIVPVITRRTIIHLEDKEIAKKLERWNKITLEACQQSNRTSLCEVCRPIRLKDVVEYKQDINLVAYENEDTRKLRDCLGNSSICIVVGPEGGFEESEIEFLEEAGFTCVSLGTRILRAETAGMYALSVIDAYGE